MVSHADEAMQMAMHQLLRRSSPRMNSLTRQVGTAAPPRILTSVDQSFNRLAAMAGPSVSYWERAPPFAAVGYAKLLGVSIGYAPDPKGTNKTVPTLRFASG